MATYERHRLNSQYWPYKISGIDIELKEKQFMNDEFEYYKEVKTKPKRNSTHTECKKFKFLR
jgi:hypothetical protein